MHWWVAASGVLVHRHADGRAVIAVNHWYVHQDIGNHACLITEVHSNIAQEGKGVSCQLADVLAVLAHELDGERLLRDLAISTRDTK